MNNHPLRPETVKLLEQQRDVKMRHDVIENYRVNAAVGQRRTVDAFLMVPVPVKSFSNSQRGVVHVDRMNRESSSSATVSKLTKPAAYVEYPSPLHAFEQAAVEASHDPSVTASHVAEYKTVIEFVNDVFGKHLLPGHAGVWARWFCRDEIVIMRHLMNDPDSIGYGWVGWHPRFTDVTYVFAVDTRSCGVGAVERNGLCEAVVCGGSMATTWGILGASSAVTALLRSEGWWVNQSGWSGSGDRRA